MYPEWSFVHSHSRSGSSTFLRESVRFFLESVDKRYRANRSFLPKTGERGELYIAAATHIFASLQGRVFTLDDTIGFLTAPSKDARDKLNKVYRELLDLENFPYKAKLSKLEEDRPKAIRYLARAIAPLDLREKKGPVTDRAQCILESAKGTLDTGRKPAPLTAAAVFMAVESLLPATTLELKDVCSGLNCAVNTAQRRYGELRKALVELGKQLPGYGGTTVANFKTNSGMILSFLQIEWRRQKEREAEAAAPLLLAAPPSATRGAVARARQEERLAQAKLRRDQPDSKAIVWKLDEEDYRITAALLAGVPDEQILARLYQPVTSAPLDNREEIGEEGITDDQLHLYIVPESQAAERGRLIDRVVEEYDRERRERAAQLCSECGKSHPGSVCQKPSSRLNLGALAAAGVPEPIPARDEMDPGEIHAILPFNLKGDDEEEEEDEDEESRDPDDQAAKRQRTGRGGCPECGADTLYDPEQRLECCTVCPWED